MTLLDGMIDGRGGLKRDKESDCNSGRGAQRESEPRQDISSWARHVSSSALCATADPAAHREPFPFRVRHQDAIDILAPRSEDARELVADPLAVATVGNMIFERRALRSVEHAVAFSENPGLSLAAVHDVGGNDLR